jgi:hypothetical protein
MARGCRPFHPVWGYPARLAAKSAHDRCNKPLKSSGLRGPLGDHGRALFFRGPPKGVALVASDVDVPQRRGSAGVEEDPRRRALLLQVSMADVAPPEHVINAPEEVGHDSDALAGDELLQGHQEAAHLGADVLRRRVELPR